jgi:CheY-like chemotaxis protein
MSVRELCLRLVEHLGYRSLGAADGVEAVRVFEAHRHEIACVILDVTMPRMDGYATFVELKRLVPEVRVVLSSGYSESEATLRFKAQGLAGFVQKPYRLAQLKAALESALSGGEPRSGGGEAAGSGAGA